MCIPRTHYTRICARAVSYTHLDVYKRQGQTTLSRHAATRAETLCIQRAGADEKRRQRPGYYRGEQALRG